MFECDVMAWGSVIYKSKALINMICDLKITSRSEKSCVKISCCSDIPLKSYQRKTVLRGHEIHSS